MKRLFSDLCLVVATFIAVSSATAIVIFQVGFASVLSNSMSPAFRAGSLVVTTPKDRLDISIGDVLLLPLPDNSGARFAHRVTEVDIAAGKILIKTQGDANSSEDPWTLEITSAEVPAVIATTPHVGWLSTLLHDVRLRLVLTTTVVALIILGFVRVLRKSAAPIEEPQSKSTRHEEEDPEHMSAINNS